MRRAKTTPIPVTMCKLCQQRKRIGGAHNIVFCVLCNEAVLENPVLALKLACVIDTHDAYKPDETLMGSLFDGEA